MITDSNQQPTFSMGRKRLWKLVIQMVLTGPQGTSGSKHMLVCSSQRQVSEVSDLTQQFTSLYGGGGCIYHMIWRV
jgi:hypothetical protein